MLAGLSVQADIVSHPLRKRSFASSPDLEGNLLGDKTWPTVFDCSKIPRPWSATTPSRSRSNKACKARCKSTFRQD